MIFSWSCSSFGFVLIPYFLSNISPTLAAYPESDTKTNVFYLAIASSIAEILACFYSSVITRVLSNKNSLISSYGLAFLGSIGFWVAKDNIDTIQSYIIYFILFSKFGVTVSFNISYVIMNELFPTLLSATSFGICNIIARFITILAPMVAILPNPYPMIIFCVLCLMAGLLSMLLKPLN
jgi:hypothetical protein